MQNSIDHPSTLKQSWWHIEDYVEPSDGRLVIRVQDFYIKKEDFEKNNCISIRLQPYFIGFKARNKNTGNELSFIEEYTDDEDSDYTGAILKVNLGRISDWEPVEKSECYHFKIQYEYTEFWPIFQKRLTRQLGVRIPDSNCKGYKHQLPKSLPDRVKLLWPPGYTGQFLMSGISQGEISITTPQGMNIKDKGKNTEIILYKGPINDTNTEKVLMEYCKPHISYLNDKLKHHYVIDGKSYKEVLSTLEDDSLNPKINFLVTYSVVNDRKFFIVPLFAIVFLGMTWGFDWTTSNLFYFVIILLSLSTLYLTLRKEKYQIPFNNFILGSIPLSIVLLVIKLYTVKI